MINSDIRKKHQFAVDHFIGYSKMWIFFAAILLSYSTLCEAMDFGDCNNVIVKWNALGKWGIDAWVRVKEAGEPAITGWSATIEFDRDVTKCVDWNAIMETISPKKYTAVGAPWNSNAAQGQEKLAKFRITYPWGTTPPKPTSLTIDGQNYSCLDTLSPTETPTKAPNPTTDSPVSDEDCNDLIVQQKALGKWGVWFEVMVKKAGEAAISGWAVTIEFDRDVNSCADWNAVMTKISASTYKAVGASWNSNAAKSQEMLGKFQVTYPWGTTPPNIKSINIEGKGHFQCIGDQPDSTEPPTNAPTEAPTESPTEAPTEAPTESPTEAPTEAPEETTTATSNPPDNDCNKKIVCYYPSWAYYRTGGST